MSDRAGRRGWVVVTRGIKRGVREVIVLDEKPTTHRRFFIVFVDTGHRTVSDGIYYDEQQARNAHAHQVYARIERLEKALRSAKDDAALL